MQDAAAVALREGLAKFDGGRGWVDPNLQLDMNREWRGQLLSTALCLERWNDARRLATDATERQKQFALTLAALKGKAEALRRLLAAGVEVNGVSQDLYSHATALHHAVSSGSLEAVTVLVAAGADLRARDTAYHGTPLGWAEYSSGKSPYDEIAAYLRKRGAPA